MTSTTRQNNLILNQDWKRIYQTLQNADFKSYDFENLRRVIISYLRQNFPEDFNDYIESSEYLALVDAIAFIGQSLAFRIDLASRENFLELAERRESVLRIAKMLSYNAKRNINASGLLKFNTVTTNEPIIDSNGKNLANQVIQWNDPTNSNWLEQFILVLNSAMADNTEFGRSQGSATIQGIPTEQYRFRTYSADVPIYAYSKTVAGYGMNFEIVSTSIQNSSAVYEEAPTPGNQLGFIYKNDGTGPGSANTGFFLMFKQGKLELADFTIDSPSTNEIISVAATNINNNDTWLFSLSSAGAQSNKWTQVSSLTGNNIIYNSISQNQRNIYAIDTQTNDALNLVFADGVYGNLPQGGFRFYYRISNGLSYVIYPNEMRGINITIPYLNSQGAAYNLTVNLALQSTVSNAAGAESTDTIRANAPGVYYTQNRMITGEDYQLAPLSSSQDILKVKSINRTSSGISRNFEIIDATGYYSSVNVFADDGYIYKQDVERSLSFKFSNIPDIINFVRNYVEPTFKDTDVYNFYLTKFDKVYFTDNNVLWKQVTSSQGVTTGYFINAVDTSLLKVGSAYATNSLKYGSYGALIKFIAPSGKAFKKGSLVTADATDPYQTSFIWTEFTSIVGDGTNAGRGELSSGLGPVTFNKVVPSGAIASRIIPTFANNLTTAIEQEIISQVNNNLNFGLRYDYLLSSWNIITTPNLNLTDAFSLGKAGDTSNTNIDSSWVLAFVKQADEYTVRIRGVDYIFGSVQQNRFYFDANKKALNSQTGTVTNDIVNVLGINTGVDLITPLKTDLPFDIADTIKFDDGFESGVEIKLSFSSSNSDGVIDNPEAFEEIVGVDTDNHFLFFQETTDTTGTTSYQLIDNTNDTILVASTAASIVLSNYSNGQLIYFYDSAEDRVMSVNLTTNTLDLQPSYKANHGRSNLKFQYIHNASVDRRIDPSSSNLIDVYLLTRSYDTAYRQWLSGAITTAPTEPTSDSLQTNFGTALSAIKSISDEIIYHPVKYKVLFGKTADVKLQAQFKVVKNPNKNLNDNDVKVRIITAINNFFDVNNWDFGDRFYLSELITYILNSLSPDVSNIVILPRQTSQVFGSLFEIQSAHDEIFISGATVDDIAIVTAITAAELRASSSSIVSTTA
jgi:hypothetical protein